MLTFADSAEGVKDANLNILSTPDPVPPPFRYFMGTEAGLKSNLGARVRAWMPFNVLAEITRDCETGPEVLTHEDDPQIEVAPGGDA